MIVAPVNGYMVVRAIAPTTTVDEDGCHIATPHSFGCNCGLVVATYGNEHPYVGRCIAYEGEGVWFKAGDGNTGLLIHERQVIAVLNEDEP